MKNPFNKQYGVSSSFAAHLRRNPPSNFPGTDYLTPYGSPIYAPEDGWMQQEAKNSFIGANVASLHNKVNKRKWFFVHLKSIVSPGRNVREGQLIGYAGNTGYVIPAPTPSNPYAGTHTHVSLKASINDNGTGGKLIDVEPVLNSITTNNTPTPAKNEAIDAMKTQISKLEARLKQEREQAANDLQSTITEKEKELVDSAEQLAQLQHEIDELKSYGKNELNINYADLATSIVEETQIADGLLNKWATFIDSKIPESWTVLRSLLKYDIFVMIGLGAGYLVTDTLILQTYGVSTEVAAVIVAGAGIVFKIFVTQYDTNKDGRLTLDDTQILKEYISE